MSSAETIQSLPRNQEELVKKGRFELRRAAEALGLLSNEEAKGAFMSLSNPDMATQVLAALQQLDKEKGGGGTAVPQKPAVRTPVTNETAQPPKQAVTNGAGQAPLAQLVEAINSLSDSIKQQGLRQEERAEELRTILRGQNRIILTAMSLSLFLAEEVLKAPRNEIIKTAHEDVATLVETLGELDPGISEAAAEDEPEEGAAGEE